MPNANIDLTTVANVKNWLPQDNTAEDSILALAVTAASQYIANFCGRDSFMLNNYTEVYDGNGWFRLFLRNWPIVTLTQVQVDAKIYPLSSGFGNMGVFVETGGRSIAIRSGSGGADSTSTWYPTFGAALQFTKGVGNVQVIYQAGYTVVPADLEEAARLMICETYRKRGWIGLKSKALATVGQTNYGDWDVAPDVRKVFNFYRRITY